jgi:penicillin-binding protein 1B
VAVKVQVPKKATAVRFALHPVGKILLVLLVLGFTTGLADFTFYYVNYSRLIDTKLAAGPFANTSMLFAAPRTVDVGDVADPQEVATDLRRSGYTESSSNRMGYFTLKPAEIDVYPGPDSYFKRDEGVIKFTGNKVTQIISLADNTDRTEYTLEPELISNLFDKNREKRRMVKYEDIPPVLVHAVVSAEDNGFSSIQGSIQSASLNPLT